MHQSDYHRVNLGTGTCAEQLLALVHGIIEANTIGRSNVIFTPLLGQSLSKLVDIDAWQKDLAKQDLKINIYDTETFTMEVIQCHYEDIDITDQVRKDGQVALNRGFNFNTLVGKDPRPGVPKQIRFWALVNGVKTTFVVPEHDGLIRDIDYGKLVAETKMVAPRYFPPDFYNEAQVWEMLSQIPFRAELSTCKLEGRWSAVWDAPTGPVPHPTWFRRTGPLVTSDDVVLENTDQPEFDNLRGWCTLRNCRGTIYVQDGLWGQLLANTTPAKISWVKN